MVEPTYTHLSLFSNLFCLSLSDVFQRDQDRLKIKRDKLIKKSFPSLSFTKSFDTDRSKLGALSETKLIKHNTLNSIPPVASSTAAGGRGEYHFLDEEK